MDTYRYKNDDKNEMIQVYMLIFFVFCPWDPLISDKNIRNLFGETLLFPISWTSMAHFNWEWVETSSFESGISRPRGSLSAGFACDDDPSDRSPSSATMGSTASPSSEVSDDNGFSPSGSEMKANRQTLKVFVRYLTIYNNLQTKKNSTVVIKLICCCLKEVE